VPHNDLVKVMTARKIKCAYTYSSCFLVSAPLL